MADAVQQMMLLWPSVVASLSIAIACAVLGVFCILRRAAFIAVVLAQVSSLGVAAALVFGWPPFALAGGFSLVTGLALSPPYERGRLPRDTVLGVIFVAATAGAILLVSGSAFDIHDIKEHLYGDLLLAQSEDVLKLCLSLLAILAVFAFGFRRILFTFVDRDMAQVMRLRVARWEALYFALLALAIAVSARLGGTLLMFACVTLPAASALLLSRRIQTVMALAPLVAGIATLLGLLLAFRFDFPLNPAIAGSMCLTFALSALWHKLRAVARVS